MQKVVLPQKVTFNKGEEDFMGQIIIEPCHPGYGVTLGNSFRRVLLSSLEGAAIVGIKVNGADHEFTTLPGVKEDILEIILNLKGLRMKFFGEDNEIIKLELKVDGEQEVTAKDITKNSKIEIINEDLHIADTTDKKAKLEIDLYVASGFGYSSIEGRETKDKEVGYIEVDSIFSPVKVVKIDIENVRVGQMTNWEKLIIDIKTDGTIGYVDAFKQAADILVEQFSFVQAKVNEEADGEQVKSKKLKVDPTSAEAEVKSTTTDDDKLETTEAEEIKKTKKIKKLETTNDEATETTDDDK